MTIEVGKTNYVTILHFSCKADSIAVYVCYLGVLDPWMDLDNLGHKQMNNENFQAISKS